MTRVPDQPRVRRRSFSRTGADGEHEGGTVHIEERWQRFLRPPPQKLPSGKEIEQLLTLGYDRQWYSPWQSPKAHYLCKRWHRSSHPPTKQTLKARYRRRPPRIKGKPLRVDDPAKRMYAWQLQEGGRIDPRPPWLSLSQTTINQVLAASTLPMALEPQQASRIVDGLCWELCADHILPPGNTDVRSHAEELQEKADGLLSLLLKNHTDFVWAPNPRSRLAHLRQELLDFREEIWGWSLHEAICAQQPPGGRKREDHQGSLPGFIAHDLWPAFAKIFDRHAPKADMHFMGFARAFFDAVQFKTVTAKGIERSFPSDQVIRKALRHLRRAGTVHVAKVGF
jgi:hypothetical protein